MKLTPELDSQHLHACTGSYTNTTAHKHRVDLCAYTEYTCACRMRWDWVEFGATGKKERGERVLPPHCHKELSSELVTDVALAESHTHTETCRFSPHGNPVTAGPSQRRGFKRTCTHGPMCAAEW